MKSLRWNSAKCNEIEQDYKRFMSELVLPLCRKWCSHTQHTETSINTAYRFGITELQFEYTLLLLFAIRGELCEFRCTSVSNFFNWIRRIGNDLLFVQRIQHNHNPCTASRIHFRLISSVLLYLTNHWSDFGGSRLITRDNKIAFSNEQRTINEY